MRFGRHLKENEDSGISSIQSNIHCELSAIEKCENLSHNPIKEDSNTSSNLSKRYVLIDEFNGPNFHIQCINNQN